MDVNFGRLERKRQTSRSADTLQRVVFQTAVLLEINLKKPMALSCAQYTLRCTPLQARKNFCSCARKHDIMKKMQVRPPQEHSRNTAGSHMRKGKAEWKQKTKCRASPTVTAGCPARSAPAIERQERAAAPAAPAESTIPRAAGSIAAAGKKSSPTAASARNFPAPVWAAWATSGTSTPAM